MFGDKMVKGNSIDMNTYSVDLSHGKLGPFSVKLLNEPNCQNNERVSMSMQVPFQASNHSQKSGNRRS